jgi:hypothetical protein
MKRNLLFTLIALVFALFGTSCIADAWDRNEPSSNTLHLSLNVQGIETRAATRGSIPAEVGEALVSNMYLLFFEPSTQGTGMFVDYVSLTALILEGLVERCSVCRLLYSC